MFFKTKPIRYYFPNIEAALTHIELGKRKYSQSDRFIIISDEDHLHARGMKADGGKYYIDVALAAIMHATGKEPRTYDLNTPAESYGWNFDATRDILSALDALSKGNDYYWNLYYGTEKSPSNPKPESDKK